MGNPLAVTFTGLRFENPFLLSSAPPTESDSNIMRAFDAGWGGVVTKTIGLHPVVNVARPEDQVPARDAGLAAAVDAEAARHGAALVVELGADLRQAARLVAAAHRADQAGPSRTASWSPRSWPARAATTSSRTGRRWRRAARTPAPTRFELNLSCPHMDRKDMGSNIGKDQELISIVTQVVKEVARVPVWAKLTPSTTDIVVEARGAFLGGADAIVVVEHLPVAAAHRSRDARVRDERRRLRLERRPRRAGHPAAVDRQDGAAHAGVPRQGVLRHRRHLDVRPGAELLPARLRHGAGVHGGDARSRDRAERDPRAAGRA